MPLSMSQSLLPNQSLQSSTLLTVSQFNQQAKRLLEVSFPGLWIEGEVSNLTRHTSGHWYFSLKDDKSQVRCVMFKNHNRLTPLTIESGIHVLVKATGSLYPARGDFQLVVQHMEMAGEGVLQRQFECLKQKLLKEGLFDQKRKQPLPSFPKHIGVITSATGAVIQDICTVFKRRYPLADITLLPAAVQGKKAIKEIVDCFAIATTSFDFDALILARGGGSLEDLQPFNEEAVARAIAACTIPVVSSIGHETDITIADFVADYRAPTPSAAAEVLSPDQQLLVQQLKQFEGQLCHLIKSKIAHLNGQLSQTYKRLKHPQHQLREQLQHLDYLTHHLQQAMVQTTHECFLKIKHVQQYLYKNSPVSTIKQTLHHLNHLQQHLHFTMKNKLMQSETSLQLASQQLDSISPLQTLSRGYSILQKSNGAIVKRHTDVKHDEKVSVKLYKGSLQCRIETISKD